MTLTEQLNLDMSHSRLLLKSAEHFDGLVKDAKYLDGRKPYSDFSCFELSPLLMLAHLQHPQGGSMLDAIHKEPYVSMSDSHEVRLSQALYDEGISSGLVLTNAAIAYCEKKFHLRRDLFGLSFDWGELSGFWVESTLYKYSWESHVTRGCTKAKLKVLIKDLCEVLLTRNKLIVVQRAA